MIEILEFAIYTIILALICRIIAIMLIYAYGYGQFLGWLKLLVAKQIDPELVESVVGNIGSVTDGYDKTVDMYDILCNRKGGWAWLLSIMDCQFCSGFWVSLFVALFCVLFFSLHWGLLILVPVLTFFFLEKI